MWNVWGLKLSKPSHKILHYFRLNGVHNHIQIKIKLKKYIGLFESNKKTVWVGVFFLARELLGEKGDHIENQHY